MARHDRGPGVEAAPVEAGQASEIALIGKGLCDSPRSPPIRDRLTRAILRAVSERIESVGGFPNRLISASSFTLREWGPRGWVFPTIFASAWLSGGLGRVVAQSGGHAFQSEHSERSALGEAVPNHGRNFAGALWRRPPLRPDRGASRLSVLIRRSPDMTLLEIQERLFANCGERFAVSVLWRFFDRHEITFYHL